MVVCQDEISNFLRIPELKNPVKVCWHGHRSWSFFAMLQTSQKKNQNQLFEVTYWPYLKRMHCNWLSNFLQHPGGNYEPRNSKFTMYR